jgi:hypothetical protein
VSTYVTGVSTGGSSSGGTSFLCLEHPFVPSRTNRLNITSTELNFGFEIIAAIIIVNHLTAGNKLPDGASY